MSSLLPAFAELRLCFYIIFLEKCFPGFILVDYEKPDARGENLFWKNTNLKNEYENRANARTVSEN